MSNRVSQFIIICEDKLQEVVACRFLKKGWNINQRLIRTEICTAGSGEKHVRDKYANELIALRARSGKTALVVVIDADKGSVKDHNNELNAAAIKNNIKPRSDTEPVVHIIPKRHIETWLAWLNSVEMDENTSYKPKYEYKNCESETHVFIDRLADNCKQNKELENPPDSLKKACKEFNSRLRQLLS